MAAVVLGSAARIALRVRSSVRGREGASRSSTYARPRSPQRAPLTEMRAVEVTEKFGTITTELCCD